MAVDPNKPLDKIGHINKGICSLVKFQGAPEEYSGPGHFGSGGLQRFNIAVTHRKTPYLPVHQRHPVQYHTVSYSLAVNH